MEFQVVARIGFLSATRNLNPRISILYWIESIHKEKIESTRLRILKIKIKNIPSTPPFPSTNFGHKSLGLKLSKSAPSLPVELTVITNPNPLAVFPRNPLTKFCAV